MRTTLALIATAAVVLVGTAPAFAKATGAYDPVTGTYRQASNDYCIRSGWGSVTQASNHLVRQGQCFSAPEWRRRGVVFQPVAAAPAKADTVIATR